MEASSEKGPQEVDKNKQTTKDSNEDSSDENDDREAFREVLDFLQVGEHPEKLMAAQEFTQLFSEQKFKDYLKAFDKRRLIEILNSVCVCLVNTEKSKTTP
eukprot:TRINITY_DN3856_c0_g1_i1.p2 TRINITY_DN3856_c0_g1~~TRINITY_DN3856_c0_g1_i1.p2  ORF type:complete len:101 (-),score=23.14 TRINITY_DN3856_c0_g1_i1:76-378(-)